MNDSNSADSVTSWTLIHAAADGSKFALDLFAQRYEQVVRNCMAARWNRSKRIAFIDDAVQEVLIECIRPGGALSKANSHYPGGFLAAHLYGVMRNVILRHETRRAAEYTDLPDVVDDEDTVGRIFDREYARATVKEASVLQKQLAETLGEAAVRRVELLHLRFYEELPIREIANRWSVDPAWLHHQYACARGEFLSALLKVVAASQPSATHAENEVTCRELLSML